MCLVTTSQLCLLSKHLTVSCTGMISPSWSSLTTCRTEALASLIQRMNSCLPPTTPPTRCSSPSSTSLAASKHRIGEAPRPGGGNRSAAGYLCPCRWLVSRSPPPQCEWNQSRTSASSSITQQYQHRFPQDQCRPQHPRRYCQVSTYYQPVSSIRLGESSGDNDQGTGRMSFRSGVDRENAVEVSRLVVCAAACSQ